MTEQPQTLVEILAAMGVVDQLLRDHYEVGGRCVCCGSATTGRTVWPCTSYTSARRAKELQNRRSVR